jgi:hypothetical protein
VAIDIDGPNSPATVSGNEPLTTASFSPPAGTLLMACVFVENSTDQAISISNSGTALTWTQRVIRTTAEAGSSSGQIAIYTAPNATAQSGITVTMSVDNVTSFAALKVLTITGAELSNPVGATGEGSSTTNNVTVNAYTSTVQYSRGFGAAHDWQGLGTPTSSDDEETFNSANVLSGMTIWKGAKTDTSGSTVTLNLDAAGTGTPKWLWVAVEILPQVFTPLPLPIYNNFSGGSDGTTITTANSGGASGTPFHSISGSPKFESDNAIGFRSPMTCLFTTSTGDIMRWQGIVLAGRELWVREYIRFTSNPSSSFNPININHFASGITNLTVSIDANGKLFVADTVGTQVGITTNSIALNTWVRYELYCNVGTTTSNSSYELRLYNTTESFTPTETISNSGLNFTTQLPDRISWVFHNGVTSYQADDFAASDRGWIGPASAAPPPERSRVRLALLVR